MRLEDFKSGVPVPELDDSYVLKMTPGDGECTVTLKSGKKSGGLSWTFKLGEMSEARLKSIYYEVVLLLLKRGKESVEYYIDGEYKKPSVRMRK
jgi:hypothetical protein